MKIHIGKAHKNEATPTPEKERGPTPQKDQSIILTPTKDLREEEPENQGFSVMIDHTDGFSESQKENVHNPEDDELREIDFEAIDQECFNILGVTVKCVISCNQNFGSKEECYKHTYLSPSKCCQKLCSNMEKGGFKEDIRKVGIQKVVW